jgi:CubicO group peptidase (beta-lactamase class C family)
MAELAGPGPDGWQGPVAAGWRASDGATTSIGPADRAFPWASVTKVVTAMAVWIAVEEGSVDWDDPVGPPGSTLRHVLSHASGLSPDDDRVLAAPGRRRIYSNRGIEVAAAHVEASTGVAFDAYAREAVVEPLAMEATRFEGSPASGASGSVVDLMSVAAELMEPRLVSAPTRDRATGVCFPGPPS